MAGRIRRAVLESLTPIALAALLVAAALGLAATATARTFTVTKRGDPPPDQCKPNDCSLREAVIAANVRPGRDVIELPNRKAPYVRKQAGTDEDGALDGDLDISNHPLVIRHPGRGRATIDAGGIERVFEVFEGAPTTFRKLVVRGGVTDVGEGGGIRSDANLKVVGSRIAANDATQDNNVGGGIGLQNDAGLRLVDSVVANNEASSGGGIDGDDGPVVILRSRILGNRADGIGGGLLHFSDVPSRIVASTMDRNRSGDGGGIFHSGSARLRLARMTVSRNRAAGRGGGVLARGDLQADNVTIALNRSGSDGGGIHVTSSAADADVRLNAVTVAGNVAGADGDGDGSGGGLLRGAASRFEVENSLIALNRLGSGGRNDCAGNPFDSLGHNLLSTRGPSRTCEGLDRATDRVRSNPRIGKLRRNGGPTRTIALGKGSPAINRAKRSTAPNRDQRAKRRGRKKDIGAYERNTGR